MIILGIDPGTATTGYGVIRYNEKKKLYLFPESKREIARKAIHCITYGYIGTSPDVPFEKRLMQLHQSINHLIKQYKPDKAIIEDLFFFQNRKTVIRVSEAIGVIHLAFAKNKLPFEHYPPQTFKRMLTDNGRADKREIQETVTDILGLEEIPKPDDVADALGMAICGAICHDVPAKKKDTKKKSK